MSNQARTVTDFVLEVKQSLEGQFRQNLIKGEISNLNRSSAGHFYFTLSDSQSSISCALFKMDAMRNPLIQKLKDGDEIVVMGPVSVYQRRGTFQVICKKLMKSGQGSLKAKFEVLKSKLRSEGLFDSEYKKNIPRFVQKLCVITAEQGAALQDFLNILKRRSFHYDVVVIPSVVQGDKAAVSLIKALRQAKKINDLDLIVMTRGGGSMEDLWCFNDEQLVREVFECQIPVISAIGHEVDFTLLDFVSDKRCETPSAAAEVISQYQKDLVAHFSYLEEKLEKIFLHKKDHISKFLQLNSPRRIHSLINERLIQTIKKLNSLQLKDRVNELTGLYDSYLKLDDVNNRMEQYFSAYSLKHNQQLDSYERMLKTMNPNNVLERGYVIVKNKNKVVTSKKASAKLNEFHLQFKDGVRVINEAKND